MSEDDIYIKNIKAVVQHSNETRRLVNEYNKELDSLKNQLARRDSDFTQLRQELNILRAIIYGNRATSGDNN